MGAINIFDFNSSKHRQLTSADEQMRRLIPSASFANEQTNDHLIRSDRRVDGKHFPQHDSWQRAARRLRQIDPTVSGSLAFQRRVQSRG